MDADARTDGIGTRDGQHVALVHDRLRAAILRGDLSAGQTTSQVTLARDLDVGRTPLREALRVYAQRNPTTRSGGTRGLTGSPATRSGAL